jgi:hypothetical protein
VRSRLGGNCRLTAARTVSVAAGADPLDTKPATGANPNPLYETVDAGAPVVAEAGQKALPDLVVPASVSVDFSTRPGGIYTITPAATP